MKPLFIFFTGEINEEDVDYLSFKAKEIDKLNDIDIYLKNDNLIFYYSKSYFENNKKEKNYIDLIESVLNKANLNIKDFNALYVFFHGKELYNGITPFKYCDDISKEVNDKLKISTEAFCFTHTDGDPIYELLRDYKGAFDDFNIEYTGSLDKTLIQYIKKIRNGLS